MFDEEQAKDQEHTFNGIKFILRYVSPYGYWTIKVFGRNAVPKELAGMYTQRTLALRDAELYAMRKPKAPEPKPAEKKSVRITAGKSIKE